MKRFPTKTTFQRRQGWILDPENDIKQLSYPSDNMYDKCFDSCGISHSYPVLLFYMKFVQIDSNPWQLFLVLEPIKQAVFSAQPSQDYVVFIHPVKQLVLDYNL